jgi:hypothetical protein
VKLGGENGRIGNKNNEGEKGKWGKRGLNILIFAQRGRGR